MYTDIFSWLGLGLWCLIPLSSLIYVHVYIYTVYNIPCTLTYSHG